MSHNTQFYRAWPILNTTRINSRVNYYPLASSYFYYDYLIIKRINQLQTSSMSELPALTRLTSLIRTHWFAIFLAAFICGFFWAPTTKSLNNFYYLFLLLPMVIFYGVSDGRIARSKQFASAYRWFFVFVAVLMVSSLANGIDPGALSKQLLRVLYVIGLLLAVNVAVQRSASLQQQLVPVIMLVISLASVYCLYQWHSAPSEDDPRMQGYGITQNSVRLGVIYGFACVVAVIAFLKGEDKASWAYLITILLTAYIVVLSQSRGPLLAVAISTGLALLVIRGRRAWLLGALLVFGGIIFASEYQDSRIFTADSWRMKIWPVVINKIALSPWLGYGLHAAEAVEVGRARFEHPHGGYITTAFFGGGLGLAALLMLIATTVLSAFKQPSLRPCLVLLTFGLVYMLFDGSRLFYHPRELWLVFWLPMAYLLAVTTPKIEF